MFDLIIEDDSLLTGSRSVSVFASATNYTPANASLIVHDNESALLTLTSLEPKPPVTEGQGSTPVRLEVWPPPDTGYQVLLISSDTSEIIMPVIGLSAGTTSAVFNATVVDDSLIDGPQPVALAAHVKNWVDGVANLTVFDKDPHHFSFDPIGTPQTGGVPFPTRVRARDINDVLITGLYDDLRLTALTGIRALPVTPALLQSVRGSWWSANVAVNSWGTNVQLIVTASNGVTSASSALDVLPALWSGPPTILLGWSLL